MSTGNEKRQRRRSTRVKRATKAPTRDESSHVSGGEPTNESAREHYRREKARRAAQTRPPEHPLEQARRAYHALIAADAERARGGRPKKVADAAPQAPKSPDEDADPEA
jgi:hypothetical protein